VRKTLFFIFIAVVGASCFKSETEKPSFDHAVNVVLNKEIEKSRRISAIQELKTKGDWKGLSNCLEPLNESKEMSILADVLVAIGEIGDPQAIPKLKEFGPVLCETNDYVNELAALLGSVGKKLQGNKGSGENKRSGAKN